jgi:hypothetical protein
MLRLVHPAREGQEGGDPPRRRRRRTCNSLTRDERRHLAVALHNLRRAYGSWDCLAEVMGVEAGALCDAGSPRSKASPGLALRAARAAGMSVEAILGGKISAAGRCETCGARVGARPERAAGGAR